MDNNRKRGREEDDSNPPENIGPHPRTAEPSNPSPALTPSPGLGATLMSSQQQVQGQPGQNDTNATANLLLSGLLQPGQSETNVTTNLLLSGLLTNTSHQQSGPAWGGPLGQAGTLPGLSINQLLASQQRLQQQQPNPYHAVLTQNMLGLMRPPGNLNPLQALQARLLLGQQNLRVPSAGPLPLSNAGSLGQQSGVPFPASNVLSATAASASPGGSSLMLADRSGIPVTSAQPPNSGDLAASLAIPDTDMKLLYTPADDTKLSPYQCLARKQIELYEATEKELEAGAQGRNRPIVLGQVGIRCRWCASLPSRQRHRASAYYPSQLSGIYQAAQNITNSHLSRLCPSVPQDIRQELVRLQAKKSGAGGGKKYWSQSASDQGVKDAEDGSGLRFAKEDAPTKSGSSKESDEIPPAQPTTIPQDQEGKKEGET